MLRLHHGILLFDGGVDKVAAEAPQARKRALLVGAREPAVTDHIRDQDCGELPGLAYAPLRRRQTSPNASPSRPVFDGRTAHVRIPSAYQVPIGKGSEGRILPLPMNKLALESPPSAAAAADLRRPRLDEPLGDNLGHDLVSVVDALAAFKAQCEGKGVGKVSLVGGRELNGLFWHRRTVAGRRERDKDIRGAICLAPR